MHIARAKMVRTVDLRDCDVFLQHRRHDGGVALSRHAGYVSSPRLLKAPKPAPLGDTQSRKERYGTTVAQSETCGPKEKLVDVGQEEHEEIAESTKGHVV